MRGIQEARELIDIHWAWQMPRLTGRLGQCHRIVIEDAAAHQVVGETRERGTAAGES